jgi:hypothetical protein
MRFCIEAGVCCAAATISSKQCSRMGHMNMDVGESTCDRGMACFM